MKTFELSDQLFEAGVAEEVEEGLQVEDPWGLHLQAVLNSVLLGLALETSADPRALDTEMATADLSGRAQTGLSEMAQRGLSGKVHARHSGMRPAGISGQNRLTSGDQA